MTHTILPTSVSTMWWFSLTDFAFFWSCFCTERAFYQRLLGWIKSQAGIWDCCRTEMMTCRLSKHKAALKNQCFLHRVRHFPLQRRHFLNSYNQRQPSKTNNNLRQATTTINNQWQPMTTNNNQRHPSKNNENHQQPTKTNDINRCTTTTEDNQQQPMTTNKKTINNHRQPTTTIENYRQP